jgi:hypothetical protein
LCLSRYNLSLVSASTTKGIWMRKEKMGIEFDIVNDM